MTETTTPAVVEQAVVKPYQSKTLWIALFMAIAAFFPVVNKWIAENPTTFALVVTGVFTTLRIATKGKISIG